MNDRPPRPDVECDELDASTDFHELFSCVRGEETRTYNLRVVPGGAELWRVSESPMAGVQSIKEGEFSSSEQASEFLEELRRTLTAGGWQDPAEIH
jgi:hypothetical protein